MKLAYAVATPEVTADVLAMRGELDDCFALVASLGYDGVELMPAEPDEVDANAVVALAERHSLEIPMVCTGELFGQEGLMFTDPALQRRARALDSVKAAIDLAARFCAHVNIGRVRGKLGEEPSRDKELAYEAFAACADYAAPRGVRILIEPVASAIADFIHTTQDGLAAAERVRRPNFGLMLDIAHMIAEEEDLAASFREASGLVHHVHVTDNDRLPPGLGNWDLSHVLEALVASGYEGWISVESWQRPDAQTACRTAHECLRPWQT